MSQIGILAVLAVLLRSGNGRNYPFFTAYQASNLVQATILLLAYRKFGYVTIAAFAVYWTTQGVVLVLRGLAVAELCRGVLGRFTGIWALAARVLLACASAIILYAVAVSDWHGDKAVTEASRGLELAIAGVVVSLFLFSRYYQVPFSRQNRALAAGFCLYSCAVVLHNTFGDFVSLRLFNFYNIGMMLVFCLSLAIWGRALRIPIPAQAQLPPLLEDDSYQQLSPAINARLRILNDRLISAWKVEAPLP
ncbi:MAG: hypothetical protein LAN71_01795 [Acidobacteriia bacterium]|nr:hypothetical protein [Terriglobia bacterium]